MGKLLWLIIFKKYYMFGLHIFNCVDSGEMPHYLCSISFYKHTGDHLKWKGYVH